VQLEGARLLALSDPADGRLAATIDRAHQLARSGLDEARRAIGMLRDDELPGPAHRGADRLWLPGRTSGARMGNPGIRVLAADDQRVVREGLAMLLGLLPDVEVVGTAANGEEALAMAGELRPDVILMDLRMPKMDGVEATRRLRASHPEIKVVVLTTYADDRSVIEALRAGALGYLTKDAGADEIRQAPNAEIAAKLFVSEATVKSHVNHMLPKIGARDRAQAVGYAYRHGLVPPGSVRR
jgi:DNA-binding NarL/FixJ family response regulator